MAAERLSPRYRTLLLTRIAGERILLRHRRRRITSNSPPAHRNMPPATCNTSGTTRGEDTPTPLLIPMVAEVRRTPMAAEGRRHTPSNRAPTRTCLDDRRLVPIPLTRTITSPGNMQPATLAASLVCYLLV